MPMAVPALTPWALRPKIGMMPHVFELPKGPTIFSRQNSKMKSREIVKSDCFCLSCKLIFNNPAKFGAKTFCQLAILPTGEIGTSDFINYYFK
jgi:hypothetical protein